MSTTRECARCQAPVEDERIKRLDSFICAACAQRLELAIAQRNGALTVKRPRLVQSELGINTIHVPRDWETGSKKNKRAKQAGLVAIVNGVKAAISKPLVTTVYDD